MVASRDNRATLEIGALSLTLIETAMKFLNDKAVAEEFFKIGREHRKAFEMDTTSAQNRAMAVMDVLSLAMLMSLMGEKFIENGLGNADMGVDDGDH